ncbi:MAG: VCBS repeat-containing protein, partial [Nitrospira sp.]|nr:VCBS repeat-containing protein [Nitrospira sp.]
TSGTASPSRLTSVQQYGKGVTLDGTGSITGGTALPAVSSTYTTIPNSFNIWTWASTTNWSGFEVIPGDFNGDGLTDIYLHGRYGTTNSDYMGLSTGSGFTQWTWGNSGANWTGYEVIPGDYNGDGKTDILLHGRYGTANGDNLGLSTGTGFTIWTWASASNWSGYEVIPGDYNGDGKADLYLHGREGTGNGDNLGLSTGSGFTIWTWASVTNWSDFEVIPGDYNGDGKSDIYLHGRYTSGYSD